MDRRLFSAILLAAGARLFSRAATVPSGPISVKGKLVQRKDGPAVLLTDDGKEIKLSGDEDTQKVLHDPRLANVQLEALGHYSGPDQFAIGPIFEKNMFVLKDGKRRRITYWCDVCSIRTYAPGVCVCCQKWTDLDLRDPNQE